MFDDGHAVTAQRSVATAMVGFVAAFFLHAIDHFRRGMSASPPAVMVGGTIQGLIVIIALILILRGHPGARWAAIVVGFGSAALFVYAHVLPTFLPDYQDSFTSGPRLNVTWFSWLSAVGEIGAGLILGFVGLRVPRRPDAEPRARRREIV